MNEDSDAKLKKYRANFIGGVVTRFNLEVFGASEGGKQGGGRCLYTPDYPCKQGAADIGEALEGYRYKEVLLYGCILI